MNTKASVAYGWGVLIVAAGVSYYFAKKEVDVRRTEQGLAGSRPTEILTWEEKIARTQAATQKSTDGGTAGGTSSSSLPTTFPGAGRSPAMQSSSTGVDTSKGPGIGQ